jgi:hypothetical protein
LGLLLSAADQLFSLTSRGNLYLNSICEAAAWLLLPAADLLFFFNITRQPVPEFNRRGCRMAPAVACKSAVFL